jgi:DNA repair photolyase
MNSIQEIKANSILIKSGLPASNWVINPYNGCLFGCMYCYAAQIARWKHPDQVWGTYLDVKINAPELLANELNNLEKRFKKKNFGSIFFSSVTDPYGAAEGNYQLTRKCLEVLADFGYEGSIAIQTKSPLVTRDIDVLKKLKNVSVGFTITSLDDTVSRFLEVHAPPVSARIRALEAFHEAGISTYAFIGPILPHGIHNAKEITELVDALEKVGVGEVWFEHINIRGVLKTRLYAYLKQHNQDLLPVYKRADTKEYRDNLDTLINRVMKNRKLRFGFGSVIYHHNLPKKKK